jgi:competence protein ComEC
MTCRWRAQVLRPVLIVIPAFMLWSAQLHGQSLEVHFISLGHGDCSLIKTPQGKYILVDAGLGIMSGKLKRYLNRQGVASLDLLILTHPDPDHYGGMKGVIKNFEVKEFIEPGIPASEERLAGLLGLLDEKRIRHTIARRGDRFTVDAVTLEVLSPPQRLLTQARDIDNANSIVLRLSAGGIRLLFTGDIEAEAEKFLLETGDDVTADILKVPHHGVSTSCTPAFLDAVKPRYAVLSCAYYAEPSRELYDRFQRSHTTWFRNDANGTVVFRLANGRLVAAVERGKKNSRLKVAPDWYKLLTQVESIPRRAQDAWDAKVRLAAKDLAEKVRKTSMKKKEEFIEALPDFIRRGWR